jgi:hypothetical protein
MPRNSLLEVAAPRSLVAAFGRRAAIALALVFAPACSSSSDSPGAGPGGGKDAGSHPQGSGGGPNDSSTGSQPEAAPPCLDAGSGVAGAVCVTEVRGRAIDENGDPVQAKQLVSACGAVQCNPGFTDASGTFSIPVGLHIVPVQYSVQVHKRVDFTAFYFELPSTAKGPIIDVGDVRSLPMPASGPELAVDRAGVPAQSVTSGEVTLDVPDGIYVRLDVESNLAEAQTPGKGRAFRALKIPDQFKNEFSPASLRVSALYALEPFESSFENAGVPDKPVNVRMSFANSTQIAAGAAVDLLALGTYIYPDWIPPSAFTKVASGHVSADGSRIDLDPGEGLPYLTWVAVRPAQ